MEHPFRLRQRARTVLLRLLARSPRNLALCLALLASLTACPGGDQGQDSATVTRSRVNAVTTPAVAPLSAEAASWCDHTYPAGQGPLLDMPPVEPAWSDADKPSTPGSGSFIWVNLWATWCKPCVRELPLLADWTRSLRSERVPLEVWYLSVDEETAPLRDFHTANPRLATGVTLRLTRQEALDPWLKRYSVDPSVSSIPIHLLAGPDGRVRCVRTGGLGEGDYPIVRELLR